VLLANTSPVSVHPSVDILPGVVTLERGDAVAGQDDTPRGAVGLGRLERGTASGAGQGAPHIQVPGVQVDVVPAQAEQFTPAQAGA
jgi:hypothetical protein